MTSAKKTGTIHFTLLAGCAALALMMPAKAQAAGFYLQEHSVSGLGTAYAGSTTAAHDASTVYYNPAGMTMLAHGAINIDGTVVMPSVDLNNTGSTLLGAPVGGPDSDDPIPVTLIPSAFASYELWQDKIWVGAGFSTPFGLSTEYSSNWYGRFDSIKSELKTYDFQPTVAVKLAPWISVGGGVDIQHATADLSNAVFDGLTGKAEVKGDDTSWGWNAGVLVTPQKGTRIGLDWRSAIHHKIKGDLNVTGTFVSNESSPASADLDLPAVGTIGVAQDLCDKWTVMAQVQWFGWHDFDRLTVIRGNGTVAENITEGYNNTTNFSLGAEYRWNKDLTVRAGYQYDPTPTDDQFRDTRVPDSDRNWVTAGATWDINSKVTVDLAGAWIFMKDDSISVTRNAGLATVSADNSSSIGIVALGLDFRF
ncbi:MAG TPA: OmpP1/FadL family transporter [Patescibacteria group bacterium]|nr:OmpP1/FadL family transporter [Patescibacteria group bacterium]